MRATTDEQIQLWAEYRAEFSRVAELLGIEPHQVSRRVFTQHSGLGKRFSKSLGVTWSQLVKGCTGEPAEAPPVDVSGLDFDDDEPDTMPGHLYSPMPEGFEPIGLSTYINGQWVKARPKRETRESAIERLVREFDGKITPCAPKLPPQSTRDDLLAIYPIGDPHIGLRGTDGSGLLEGASLLMAAARDIVQRGPRTKTAIVAPMGDLFHSDDPSNVTRRSGHELDVDGAWFDILKVGRDVVIHTIDAALEHHDEVLVKIVIGNHDDLSSAYMQLLMDAWYRDEPRVKVADTASPFYWHEFGQNLFGFHHGHTAKKTRLPAVMANRQKEAWGRTSHRFFWLGHLHTDHVIEEGGVRMEQVRTLSTQDAYTDAAGYVSGRDLKRVVYRRSGGECERSTVTPESVGFAA